MNAATLTELADLKNRFAYHQPPADLPMIAENHAATRDHLHNAAIQILHMVPAGRERALAFTKLEEAMMWANAGIARHHEDFREKQG